MLFSSYIFIFLFLPVSLLIYHGLQHAGFKRFSIFVLTLLSLFFYGWWNPVYILLLVPLTLLNYAIAKFIILHRNSRPYVAKTSLVIGLTGNLAVLSYFKYANFFIYNINEFFGLNLFLAQIVLPLGISFFTFQKIAFLVDSYRGKVEHLNLLDFSLFVSFFPQLIAGPIVHHSEVLPQLDKAGRGTVQTIALGITIFTIGLAKKVLLADTAALYATPQFSAAAAGTVLSFMEAWGAALAYTMQLYFDFSGYCDMAIGAALLFGIRLPVNFNSPYKAVSIIDFWRRWHITLSRFLRDYLYIQLGGNRHGAARRYTNLLLTMLLGGLWHGANWTFVIWGGLHGLYLVINHAWNNIGQRYSMPLPVGQMLTFTSVVIAWVFFRAADSATALSMLSSMAGLHGGAETPDFNSWLIIILLLLVARLAPNTQEMTGYVGPDGIYGAAPATHIKASWQPSLCWAMVTGFLFALSVACLSRISEFIYFQF